MESDIQLLELADGIKDALINAGFFTIKSILSSNTSDISSQIGVDLYVAQIIVVEAKRITTEMTKLPTVLDTIVAIGTVTPTRGELIRKSYLNKPKPEELFLTEYQRNL